MFREERRIWLHGNERSGAEVAVGFACGEFADNPSGLAAWGEADLDAGVTPEERAVLYEGYPQTQPGTGQRCRATRHPAAHHDDIKGLHLVGLIREASLLSAPSEGVVARPIRRRGLREPEKDCVAPSVEAGQVAQGQLHGTSTERDATT
ncbi:unannotated protein [freshwater metagenome]|uniref:Unannotated protein n=1 Tax=freshwater metagenome TaxID=449393 RepID=A0A6J7UTA9_9ZZZZ